MSESTEHKLGVFSTLSIGIGGMVGGGIFAVTGLAVELTHGAAPLAFVVAGLVALLSAYSYWKLTLAFPSEGGTVEFLNRGYGTGVLTGALNILLCLSYVVLLSIYAYAFGSYAARLCGFSDLNFWRHAILSGVVVVLAFINFIGPELVLRSENIFNAGKLVLLAVFVVVGLATPMPHAALLEPSAYGVSFGGIFCGAMIIFLNYEGFELIANAVKEVKDPEKTIPIAFLGGVASVIVIYVLIAIVTVGHVAPSEIAAHSTYALSEAAKQSMGKTGSVMVAVAALLATSSAINATFYGSGRLTYIIAKSGELPHELERSIRGQPSEGMFIFAGLTLVVANLVPLDAIATMGSAGFLIIFMAVNGVAIRKAKEIGANRAICVLAALACAAALVALCWQTVAQPKTRWQIWILVGMLALAWGIEALYRSLSGRQIKPAASRATLEK
jgi:uncharacterized protein